MKRAVDLSVALVLSVMVLPALVVACVVTAVSLRAWPLFTQERIGQDGRPFRFVKIRSLPPSTPQYADKYSVATFEAPWFCRMLRRCHLDELPQLFLVVAGRMSLVGPRPEMPQLHRGLEPGFALERTRVRPGCTGLWQIGDQCHRLIGESPEFDRFYLANQTLALDTWILWRTVCMVVSGRTVTMDEVPEWAQRRVPVRPAAEAAIGPVEVH